MHMFRLRCIFTFTFDSFSFLTGQLCTGLSISRGGYRALSSRLTARSEQGFVISITDQLFSTHVSNQLRFRPHSINIFTLYLVECHMIQTLLPCQISIRKVFTTIITPWTVKEVWRLVRIPMRQSMFSILIHIAKFSLATVPAE